MTSAIPRSELEAISLLKVRRVLKGFVAVAIAASSVGSSFGSQAKISYAYQYDLQPVSDHADSAFTQLKNGIYVPASTQSVQFNDDVTVTADFGESRRVGRVDLYSFVRSASGGFVTGGILIQTSTDGGTWLDAEGSARTLDAAPLVGHDVLLPGADNLSLCRFRLDNPADCRYVRVTCKLADGYSRQLLSELEFFEAPSVWTGNAGNGLWGDSGNWSDENVPQDGGSVRFTKSAAISLNGELVRPSRIELDEGELTFSNGAIEPSAGRFSIDAASGTKVCFDIPVGNYTAAVGLAAENAGEIVFNREMFFDGESVVVSDGVVQQTMEGSSKRFVPGTVAEGVFPSYATAASGAFCRFTVGAQPIQITHLGFASAQAPQKDITVRVFDESAENYPVAVLFGEKLPGFELFGCRYARTSDPVRLEPNRTYRIYCSDAELAPVAILNEIVTVPHLGRIFVAGELRLSAPVVNVKGLLGSGSVSVLRAASPLLLQDAVTDYASTYFHGTIKENAPAGLFGLTLCGSTSQHLEGVNVIGDMVFIHSGNLCVPSSDSIGSSTPVVVGAKNYSNDAWLRFTSACEVTNPLGFLKEDNYNRTDQGVIFSKDLAGKIKETRVHAYDAGLTSYGGNGRFFFGVDAGSGSLDVTDVVLDYGGAGCTVTGASSAPEPTSVVRWENVAAPSGVRRLIVINKSGYRPSRAEFSNCGTLAVDYVDYSGPGIIVSYADLTIENKVAVRFSQGYESNPLATSYDADITLGRNAIFVSPSFADAVRHVPTTNTLFRFNGGTLRPLKDPASAFFSLTNSAAPSTVGAYGLTVNQDGYESSRELDVGFLSPLVSGAAGRNPVTIENGGVCTFAAPMSYNGPTTVKGSRLELDLTQGRAAELGACSILNADMDIALEDGASVSFKTPSRACTQVFHSISNLSSAAATVEVSAAESGIRTGALQGNGGFVKTGEGELVVRVPAGNADNVLEGKTVVSDGQFAISSPTSESLIAFLPDGSFEPVEPLTKYDQANAQRYGATHAPWLTANLPAWTFDPVDSVGVASVGSYFGTAVADGKHYALLRKESGRMTCAFTLADSSRCKVTYAQAARPTANNKVQLAMWVDGVRVHTSEVSASTTFVPVEVDLGTLPGGRHTLAFGGVGENGDGLLDAVRLGASLVAGRDPSVVTTRPEDPAHAARVVQTGFGPSFQRIADGSFEPDDDLTQYLPNSGQKYGDTDRLWLQAHIPSWTLDANNNVGIACVGSYFGNNVQEGKHYGLVRGTTGRLSFSAKLEATSQCKVSYFYASRVTATSTMKAQVGTWLNGEQVHISALRQSGVFVEVVVDLGLLAAGTHTVSFGGVGENADGILDCVCFGAAPVSGTVSFGPKASIDVAAGAKLNFDFDGRISLPKLSYDGKRIYGEISAKTCPDFVTGSGAVWCESKGTILLVR